MHYVSDLIIYEIIRNFPPLYKNIKIKIYRIIVLPIVLYGCDTWSGRT